MPVDLPVTGNRIFRLPAEVKLVMAMTVMLASGLIPAELWMLHMLLPGMSLAGLWFVDVSFRDLARRLMVFLPMLLILGLSIPITQVDNPAAWSWMASIWLRCLTCFLAGLWLIHVLPFRELLITLIRWRCPVTLVAMLAFMYRYLFVLRDELTRLRRARAARNYGDTTAGLRIVASAQMIGLLFLRAMERAERSHQAMLARGWHGSMQFLGDESESA